MRAFWPSCLLIAAAACGGDDGSESAPTDGGADGDACVPFARLVCSGNDAYWEDSCGELGELAAECTNLRPCNPDEGRCCDAARATGPLNDLETGGFLYWSFDAPGSVLELALEPGVVPEADAAAPQVLVWRFDLGGETIINAGVRTILHDSDVRGAYLLLDSTAPNPDILRLGSGSTELSANGAYGAELAFDWTSPVTLKLVADSGDWFDFFLVQGQVETLVGGLQVAGGSLPSAEVGFIHLLAGPDDYSEAPLLEVGFSTARLDGAAATGLRLEYGDFVNSDVSYFPSTGSGELRVGGLTPRCQQDGQLLP